MNRSLFLSRHALVFALVVGSFLGFALVTGQPFGRAAGSPGFQVASGWTTLALMLLVVGYVLRKYSHKGRYSPEFKMRVDVATLERGDAAIIGLRSRMAGMSKRDIEREAKVLLKASGAWKVNRVVVEPALVRVPGSAGDTGEWTVRIVPRQPLGRVAAWMHAHLYYGLGFAGLLAMHAGNPFALADSAMGVALGGLAYLTFFTGIVGIWLWSIGPSRLTRAEHDLTVEEAYGLRETLEAKRTAALDEFAASDPATRSALQKMVDAGSGAKRLAERTLGELRGRSPDRSDAVRDAVTLILLEQRVKEELGRLLRVRMSFMSWKLLHVPVAAVLCGLVALHVVSVWRY